MKAPDSSSAPLLFLKWTFGIPICLALTGAIGFAVLCWIGDGTLANLYEVEYFLPLPFYLFGVFVFILKYAVPLGALVSLILCLQPFRPRATYSNDGIR